MAESGRVQFVQKLARKVLSDCGISDPPVDLLRILKSHGIEYVEVDDFPDTVSALIVESETRTYAAINSKEHLHRQRFSLAHELGHFFLHRGGRADEIPTIDNPPSEDWQEGGKAPAEAEADLFAGELLVPKDMLKRHYRKGMLVPELSKIFLVSDHVVSISISKHFNSLFK